MFRGHPKGLTPLFITEAWERFCFYGVRSILPLYMTGAAIAGGLGWSDGFALKIYGWYLFFAYIATIIGGWVADRYWGQRRSIYVGGVLMSMGYFLLAFNTSKTFVGGLACIALGNGFFKPCVTSIFGCLYKPEDPARDSGYSLFYMGINLGAMIGPFACGSFMGPAKYSLGFMVAGAAMLVALVVFLRGRHTLGDVGIKPQKRAPNEVREPITKSERKKLGVVVVLSLLIMFFFIAFEQGGGLISLYTKENTRRMIGGFEIPVPWFQSLNALFVIVLGPLMAWMWSSFVKRGINWTVCYKFALGFFLTGTSFLVMMGAAREYMMTNSSSMLWLVFFNILVTGGELCLTPILWSNVSRITPTRFISIMMATTLTCIGVGFWFAGQVGALIESFSAMQIFTGLTITMFVLVVVALGFNGVVERLTHDRIRRKKGQLAADL